MTEPADRVGHLAVLGPVAVGARTGGRADAPGWVGALVEPAGHRAKAVLVALALAAPRAVGVERLAEEVWGDDPPRGVKAALQTQVSRIRSSFGDGLIESTPSGYRLGGAVEVDLLLAERMLAEIRAHVAASAWADAALLGRTALALWRGEPGADLDEGSDAAATLAERAGRALDGLEAALATALIAVDAAREAETLARGLALRSPFDDTAHLLLMRALDTLGRSTEAVAVYAEFRERVQDAFGTSPARELQSLNLDLLDRTADAQRDTAGSQREMAGSQRETAGSQGETTVGAGAIEVADGAPPTPSGATRATDGAARATDGAAHAVDGAAHALGGAGSDAPQLPQGREPGAGRGRGIRAAPNELIGREEDVERVEQLLGSARVTTILGAGGLGKTRLAHEVAARGLSRFGSVVVVELASVRSADDLVFALAGGLGIRDVVAGTRLGDLVVRADLRTRILSRLAETPTLLVLDNCEHLIDAAAEWSAELTAEVGDLTVLTTSRTPLAISSERVYALPTLGTSDSAVRLFLDRARAARPGAALPIDTVTRVCRRLDGLPLAIELAAARIRSMPLDEIERRLNNRLALLTGGDRTAPERHRTLFAVIEWSWNLLGTVEQSALARLSEFADGFGADSAAAVMFTGGTATGTAVVPAASAIDDDRVLDVLDALVAQSLLLLRETEHGVRYRMLETVREFGRRQLDTAGTRDEVQNALFAWAEEFCRSRRPDTDGPRQVPTFAAIAVEEDNLVDVLRRAIAAGRSDTVASVFALLSYYWSLRSAHSEVLAFSRPVFQALRHYRPEPAGVDDLATCLIIITATTALGDLRFAVRPLSMLRRLVREHPLTDPRLATMADLLLAVNDQQLVDERMRAAIASEHRPTALIGTLVSSLLAENAGRRDEAVASAQAAARIATSIDDTWGDAMASQMLGALYSQSAEPVEALRWARRSQKGLALLGAEEDLRQLEWVIGTNAIALGDLDEARGLFDRLVESTGMTDGVETRSIGLAGLAEVLRAEGRFDEAKALYLNAIACFDDLGTRSSPWYRMVLSSVLSAFVLDGTAEIDETRDLASRLRARTLASIRTSWAAVDRPVLGASVIGLAVWLMEGRSALAPAGLELLALAEEMGARQDPPALHIAPLFARYGALFGTAEIADARARAASLPAEEGPERVADILRTRGPWSPARD